MWVYGWFILAHYNESYIKYLKNITENLGSTKCIEQIKTYKFHLEHKTAFSWDVMLHSLVNILSPSSSLGWCTSM
jgi:hypothetical protein